MNQDSLQIRLTADGSATLFSPELNETYHSLNGALSESRHVYIKNGLDKIKEKQDRVRILEIGFGTAMNALLTLEKLTEWQDITYHSLEPNPLSIELLRDYYGQFSETLVHLDKLSDMCQAVSGRTMDLMPGFHFTLFHQNLQDFHPPDTEAYDLIYYDAFAPSRQSELWSLEIFKKVRDLMKPGALLSTYCAQGQFKRNLKALEFEISHPAGPNGKREMTNALRKL